MYQPANHFVALLLVALLVVTSTLDAVAAPKLPAIFSSNMVLQRDKPVPMWGWAEPGETVTVEFAEQSKTATTNDDGEWSLKLDAMPASSEERAVKITSDKSDKTIAYNNVVVGDVWFCSGQSNMEWTVSRSANPQAEAAAGDFPLIRHIKVNRNSHDLPQDDFTVSGGWQVCAPNTVGNFTAVGYFFGRELHRELNVPIGLVGNNWGGTRVEPWTAPEGFRGVPQLKQIADLVDGSLPTTDAGQAAYLKYLIELKGWLTLAQTAVQNKTDLPAAPSMPNAGTSHQSPNRIYNAMVHPMVPYAIRGAIWYQGESNGGEGESYFHKKTALIQGWREVWGQGDFPFYFVQLANYRAPTDTPEGGDGWAKLREAQRKTLTLPNTGMAVIIDVGQANDIHPKNKQDVGKRLSLWALANEYGQDIVYSGPLFKSHIVENDQIRVTFDHTGTGLMVGKKTGLEPTAQDANTPLQQFAIAGEDKVWHWATAEIQGKSIVLKSDAVPNPVAVRYAYRINPQGANLYNKEGLPASPFRTDDW